MAISLSDARQLFDEVLEALRLRALCCREPGFTHADVADLLECLGRTPPGVCGARNGGVCEPFSRHQLPGVRLLSPGGAFQGRVFQTG